MASETEKQQRIIDVYATTARLRPDQRGSFLRTICAGDGPLHDDVEGMLAATDPTWAPGQTVGHYRVLSRLGHGAMGQVFLAEDLRLGRRVALKFLHAPCAEDDERARRFLREAKAASALSHPNVVTVFEFGECESGSFLAMELVQGATLGALVAKSLPATELIGIASQLAKALAVAHGAGIIHGDVKPENVVLRDDGYVKILDFGLARLISRPGVAATITELPVAEARADAPELVEIAGTLAYMSPEQARGDELTTATDLFSLGTLLYQLATRKHPFVADTPAATVRAILTEDPPPPSLLAPDLPSGLEQLILRCLEKNPEKRITAAELDQGLSAIREPLGETTIPTLSIARTRTSIGRSAERDHLRAALDLATRGDGRWVVVTGEAGAGKTTLVDDFLLETQAAGRATTIARASCSERLRGSAYFPVLALLESLASEWTGSLAETMRSVAPTWYAEVAATGDREGLAEVRSQSPERLRRELVDFVERASRLQPLVVFLDDLHWADEPTVEILGDLAGRASGWPLLVVVTYRPLEMASLRHPFLDVERAVEERGNLARIDLEFFSAEEVARYLDVEFPGNAFSPELVTLVYDRTHGHPLFVADLIRHLRGRGVIHDHDDTWMQSPVVPADLPRSVDEMIEARLESLDPDDREILATASIQGAWFDSAVVARASGLDPERVEDRLADLDRRYALVRLVGEHELPAGVATLRYRFVHALYQNVLHRRTKPARRTRLSGAVADALLAHHGEHAQTIALGLALLLEAAGDALRAATFFAAAAANAARLFAFGEAVQLARHGLDLLDRVPASNERDHVELGLQSVLGGPLTATRGFTAPEVAETHARARELFHRLGEPAEHFPTLFGQWAFYFSTAQVEVALDAARQAIRQAERDPKPISVLLANHLYGSTLLHRGDFEEALASLRRAMDVYSPEEDRKIVAIAQQSSAVIVWSWAAFALDGLGLRNQARQTIREAVRIGDELGHPPSRAAAAFYAATVHQLRREPKAAREHATTAVTIAEEHGLPFFLFGARQVLGWAECRTGNPEIGRSHLEAGLGALASFGTLMARPYFLAMYADALLNEGDLERATEIVEEGLTLVERTGDTYHEPELHRSKAEILVRRGDATTATDEYRRAIEIARRHKARLFELRALHGLSGVDPSRCPELMKLLESFDEGWDTADLRAARETLAAG